LAKPPATGKHDEGHFGVPTLPARIDGSRHFVGLAQKRRTMVRQQHHYGQAASYEILLLLPVLVRGHDDVKSLRLRYPQQIPVPILGPPTFLGESHTMRWSEIRAQLAWDTVVKQNLHGAASALSWRLQRANANTLSMAA
jgi:hypothetical protein